MKPRSNSLFFSLFITLNCLFLVSCGPESFNQSFEKKRPKSVKGHVFNGTQVREGEAPFVVALVSEGRVFCSGVLLHPRLVATAAHCISEDKKPFTKKIKVYTGPGKENGYVDAQFNIVKAAANPLYRTLPFSVGLADTGYVVLEKPINLKNSRGEKIDFPKVWTSPKVLRKALIKGEKTKLFGFGRRGKEREDGFGLKFTTGLRIKSHTSNEVVMEGGETDACPGDSGGPVFYKNSDGLTKVLALVSRGTGLHCNGKEYDPGSKTYTKNPAETTYSLLYDSLCWISKDSGITIEGASEVCFDEGLKAPKIDPTYEGLKKTSFLKICQNPETLSKAQKETLWALLEKSPKKTCEESSRWLEAQTDLDLSMTFLTDLSPLLTLPNIESLSIEHTPWRNAGLLKSLSSLKKATISYRKTQFKEYLKVKESGIDIKFVTDLSTLFVVEISAVLEEKNWDKYYFYLKMGLNPEDMLIHIAGWENRLFFEDILSRVETFSNEYAGTTAIDFAIYQNDLSLFKEVIKKGPYFWDSLSTVLDVEDKKWVDIFLNHFDEVSADDFLKVACEYENLDFVNFLLKEKNASLKKVKQMALEEDNEDVLTFLKKHFPEL